MLASLQLAPAFVELAVIAEVSVVIDAVVVSAAPLSFLLHAATAMAATARVTTLNRDTSIVRPSQGSGKNRSVHRRRYSPLVGDQGKNRTHAGPFPMALERCRLSTGASG